MCNIQPFSVLEHQWIALEHECAVRLSIGVEWVEHKCGCFAARVLERVEVHSSVLVGTGCFNRNCNKVENYHKKLPFVR
jgi:hypothetical protein